MAITCRVLLEYAMYAQFWTIARHCCCARPNISPSVTISHPVSASDLPTTMASSCAPSVPAAAAKDW